MSWDEIRVRPEHGSQFAGHEIVGVLVGALPTVIERLEVETARDRPWDVVEEFVARSIADVGGFRDAAEVAAFLGFGGAQFVEPMIRALKERGLVVPSLGDGTLMATDELRALVATGRWREVERVQVDVVRQPTSGVRRLGGTPERSGSGPNSPSVPAEDREGPTFDRDGTLTWLRGSGSPFVDREVVDVRRLRVEPGPGLGCEVVVFVEASTSQWDWAPFDPAERVVVTALRPACSEAGAQTAAERCMEARVPDAPSVDSAAPLLAMPERAVRIATTPPVGAPAGPSIEVHRLGTVDGARRVKQLVTSASREILMVFPWVRRAAVESLLPFLRRAVERGVLVVIGYGIDERESAEKSDREAINALRSLRSGKSGGCVSVLWLGNTHVKELVFDRSQYVAGSHNLLSFIGDPDRVSGRVRQEMLTHISHAPALVLETLAVHRDGVRQAAARTARAGREGSRRSVEDWLSCWRVPLVVAPSPALVRDALEVLPEAGKASAALHERIARDLADPWNAQERDAAVDAYLEWIDGPSRPFGVDPSRSRDLLRVGKVLLDVLPNGGPRERARRLVT